MASLNERDGSGKTAPIDPVDSVNDDDVTYCCKESITTAQARLSVSVPRGLGRKIKLLAHDRDMTVSELLLHLIKTAIH
jgi:hypothetical protein